MLTCLLWQVTWLQGTQMVVFSNMLVCDPRDPRTSKGKGILPLPLRSHKQKEMLSDFSNFVHQSSFAFQEMLLLVSKALCAVYTQVFRCCLFFLCCVYSFCCNNIWNSYWNNIWVFWDLLSFTVCMILNPSKIYWKKLHFIIFLTYSTELHYMY